MFLSPPAWNVPQGAARLVIPALLAGWAGSVSWDSPHAATKLVLTVVVTAALLWGPRWPLMSLVATFAGLFAVASLPLPTPEDAFLGMVVYASFLVGRHASLARQPWAATGVLLLLSVNVLEPGGDVAAADVVFPVLFTAAPWLLGLSVQVAHRRELAALRFAGTIEQTRGEDVRRATAEERLRIAQELHDVVAHAISGISLQAQVARRATEAGHAVGAQELRSIERTAQQAMADLRRLLGVLRPLDGRAITAPAEGLEQVGSLVAEARRIGQQVQLDVRGEPRELPPALAVAAYRIVQEALTNARRHGTPGMVRLSLVWSEESVTLRVQNPTASSGPKRTRGGHGLEGIEERARMFGGQTNVTEDPERKQWSLEVLLPTPRPAQQAR
jgi:signal transduction histidine kinase